MKKLGFNDELSERSVTLIKYHTLMSSVAFKENIHNEKTLYKFMSNIEDSKNLKLLYILTYADINGVGGNAYNSFNAELLNELYNSALEVSENNSRITDAKKRVAIEKRVKNHENFKTLSPMLQKKILRVESNLFFFQHSPKDIIDIANEAKTIKEFLYSIDTNNALSIEIYRKIPINIGYLLSKLSHLDVGSMEIFTLFDGIKYFKIKFKNNIDNNDILNVEEIIENAFDMNNIVQLKDVTIKRDEINIDCEHSMTHAEISVNTKNQIGLLAYIMDCFEQLGINIVTAKIHSTKNKVKDSFLMEKQHNICNNVEEIYALLTKEK
jgi:[protein-PII] uridylyltransferase